MSKLHYFAYGSNMDMEDFREWCAKRGLQMVNFSNRRTAKLNGYRLAFNYYSERRGGGAANIMENEESCVYGLLSEIEATGLETIRKKEGYSEDCSKCYYNEICVNVEVDGTTVSYVKTYKVSKSREKPDHQPPTRQYLSLLITNAMKKGFPYEYVKFLESIPAKN